MRLYLTALSTLSFIVAIGQTELYEFNPGGDDVASAYAFFGDYLIINALDPDDGFEPFISDGTTAGTALLKDIDPSGSSLPTHFTPFGDLCIFRAMHPTYGQELWVTDGTEAGTQLLVDAYEGTNGGIIEPQITVLGDYAYFAASDEDHGEELWRTDGTPAGTERLTDINDDQMSAQIKWMTATDSKIFFVATDNWDNHELYAHLPASLDTYEVDDINGESNQSSFEDFWPTCMAHYQGDEVMFACDDGSNGKELWISDGLGGSTYLVKDINPAGDSNPCYFHSHNGLMYFFADDGTHGVELWRSDGTEAGTYMVIDATPGINLDPWITSFGDFILFRTSGSGSGSELFISDGTEAGTSLLKQVDNIQPDHPTGHFEGLYFFGGRQSGAGIEVWASDGTTDGTTLFADVDPGSSHGQPHNWQHGLGKLWFLSNDDDGHNLYFITEAQVQAFCALANDECTGAESLVVDGIPTALRNFSCATDEGDMTCGNAAGSSLWYEFVAPASGIIDYEISLFGNPFGDFNPRVSIAEGACGAITSLQCADNNVVNANEIGSVGDLTPGNSYYFILHESDAGSGLFNITLTEGEACPGDYNTDGIIDSSDLLDFLTFFGCTSSCTGDLNGDDQVLSDDLLIFLTLFGGTCP